MLVLVPDAICLVPNMFFVPYVFFTDVIAKYAQFAPLCPMGIVSNTGSLVK